MIEDNTEEPKPPPQETQVVFVDNLSEDVWPLIESMSDPKAYEVEILENVYLTDPHFLGIRSQVPGDLTYIAPTLIEPDYLNYVENLLDTMGNLTQIITPKHTGVICRDLDAVKLSFDKSDLEIRSYCASKYLYQLINKWRGEGYKISLPEMSNEEDFDDTVGLFGTKGGLRKMLAEMNASEVLMAPGKVFDDLKLAVDEAVVESKGGRGVVVKTNKGHAGLGVVIFTPGELDLDDTLRRRQIIQKLQVNNGFWDKFPVIVEKFVEVNTAIGGGLPDVECKVNPDGSSEVLYTCGMRVVEGVFCGVEFGKGVFSEVYESELNRLGSFMANEYSKRGYRGFFDVDCLADGAGRILVSESNVRRTGGTYAYLVAKRLLGESWRDYNMATRTVCHPNLSLGFDGLMKILGESNLLYDKKLRRGVIVASSNLLKMNKLSYMIIGMDKTDTLDLEMKLHQSLRIS